MKQATAGQRAICGRRLRRCRKCARKFSKDEHDLLKCPDCGEGRICQHAPAKGQRGAACHLHGGASLRGMAHPAYQGKGFSKYLPTDLGQRYEAALSDPDLLRLRSEAALLLVRQTELMQRLASGEGGAAWRQLLDAWSEFETASKAQDVAGMQSALAAIGEAIKTGASNEETWDELKKFCRDRAAVVRDEVHLMQVAKHLLPVEWVQMIMARLGHVVRENVTDRRALNAIGLEFARIYGRADERSGQHTEPPADAAAATATAAAGDDDPPRPSSPQVVDVPSSSVPTPATESEAAE